jgi:FtsH-binding integral membrane protein
MYETEYGVESRPADFLYGVYAWMAAALLLTAATAYYVAITPALFTAVFSQPATQILLFVVQIALVLILSFFIMRMSFATALVCFLLYAISLGFTLSVIFYMYSLPSVYLTFLTTAGMFGFMSIYGYFTRTDLTTVGNISIMLLFGMLIAFLVNFFLKGTTLDLVLSGIGVIIFTLLTAYDTQKLKQLASQFVADQEIMAKVALIGALVLYLDFINLFLFLLRFMGQKRES